MKKCLYFLVAVMAVVAMSCERTPKVEPDVKPNDFAVDLVIVNQGRMSFYDVETQKLTPFVKETDSVLNLLFDDNNHLYYTVTKDQNLSLKMIDLNVDAPEPTFCADWNMELPNAIDIMTGEVSGLYWDKYKESFYIYKIDYEEYSMSTVFYNTQSGEVKERGDEEAYEWFAFDTGFDQSHFYTEDRQLYYVCPEGKICVTDKIDLRQTFVEEDEEELEDMYFEPMSISPDGQRLVFEAVVIWGEGYGYYGVSDLDGSSQHMLNDSDIWDNAPKWYADGSLVYVGKVPRPKDDPEYEENWNTTQPCLKLITPDNDTIAIAMGKTFAMSPLGVKQDAELQGNLEGCDVALFDKGKITFYNSTTGEFVPFVNEPDSVINGVFVEEADFYYTVAIGGNLYLKEMYLSDYVKRPSLRADWELKLDDCVSETYGRASSLYWRKQSHCIGINHSFSWDFYDFSDVRFFDYYDNTKKDGWEFDDEETDSYDEDFLQYMADMDMFGSHSNNFYYYTPSGNSICISDKLKFKDYCSDPAYYSEPEFEMLSIDPTRKNVAYVALIEWGDLGHGPLCFATLDGKVQKAFGDTDAADMSYGWLKNGSMLYAGADGIMIVKPNGTVEVFSHASDFVVSQ